MFGLVAGVPTPVRVLNSNEVPFCPRLVVIKMTPLAPLEPYIPVAAASFKISTDSMSLGLMAASGLLFSAPELPRRKYSWVMGIPSITYSGSPAADTDATPRTRISDGAPATPDD